MCNLIIFSACICNFSMPGHHSERRGFHTATGFGRVCAWRAVCHLQVLSWSTCLGATKGWRGSDQGEERTVLWKPQIQKDTAVTCCNMCRTWCTDLHPTAINGRKTIFLLLAAGWRRGIPRPRDWRSRRGGRWLLIRRGLGEVPALHCLSERSLRGAEGFTTSPRRASRCT